MSSIDYNAIRTIEFDPTDVHEISFAYYEECLGYARLLCLEETTDIYRSTCTGTVENIVKFMNFALPENERCSDQVYWNWCDTFR